MAAYDKDEVPMLSSTRTQLSDECLVDLQRFTARSASMSLPMYPTDSYEGENYLVAHTGPLRSERRTPFIPMSGPLHGNRKAENFFQPMLGTKGIGKPAILGEELPSVEKYGQTDWQDDRYGKNENLLKSGPLGKCNDPYCTTCPSYYKFEAAQQNNLKAPALYETKFHNALYGDAKGWARRSFSFLNSYVSSVMNPHTKVVQQWNKFFVISCMVAIFVDPLFFFLLSVQKDNKCITLNWSLAKAIVAVRSLTDFIYLLNMLLQFKLAYVAPESTVVGAGDLVDHPKKIALHYLKGYFLLDLFIVFPLPQILILHVIPAYVGLSAANDAKNLLRVAVLLQYIPRMFRFLPLLAGQSASSFIFESAWANFVINLLVFVLAGHVVGSCWYLFGLQRVNQCLRNVCAKSNLPNCTAFIDCREGDLNHDEVQKWRDNSQADTCFSTSNTFLTYGIYEQAVLLSTNRSIIKRYIYSLFWGFQQISTLAGNQIPSDFVWEVLFTMAIVGLGLLLFALLIGNMQNFLLSLGRRRLEMQLRRRDVEHWMRHRRLPGELRRLVRQSERFNWAATQGVNEEMLLENLPEDLQRDIRRHLFKFVKKVRIFTLMDTPILDAICERLRQKLYIEGSEILYHGGPVEKLVFIVRGKMESIGGDGHKVPLSDGDVCGEELLTWCLENCSVNKDVKKIRFTGQKLISTRKVKCLTNVEAFALQAADLEAVTALFTRFLRNPRVQGAIRYESPYWRLRAATCIQVAWRYRQKRLNQTEIPHCRSSHMERY